ncbi:PilZ domain-containing protein [Bdellovibrio bacteriovorus]|uniref:PilZ domain-containing protein n=1 Tax=Bdellovibrio bacteriovorus TaxID=959 RepID=UPI00397798B0
MDLSYTGARIAVPEGTGSYAKGQAVSIQLSEINDIQCEGRVIDMQGGILRVHFAGLNSSEKELLRQWLSSQNLQKT